LVSYLFFCYEKATVVLSFGLNSSWFIWHIQR